MVETRKLADYLPYSMEIDGASILRSNREMIHINLPVSNKMPVAERIVAGLYLVASTSGVDTANILQVAASEFGANLATMRTFSSDSTASMDTALGELQRLKRIAVGKLLADGIAEECTVFANCEIPELDKYFFKLGEGIHPILLERAKDTVHCWKNAEKGGGQNGIGGGVRPGGVDDVPVRTTANLVKSELLSWARIAQTSTVVVLLIQHCCAALHLVFVMIAGVVNHRMLILCSLADGRLKNRLACVQGLELFIKSNDDTSPYYKHAIELRAELRDPVMTALEVSIVATYPIHKDAYRMFQEQEGFILHSVRRELLGLVARLTSIKDDGVTVQATTVAFDDAWAALAPEEMSNLTKRLRIEHDEYTVSNLHVSINRR